MDGISVTNIATVSGLSPQITSTTSARQSGTQNDVPAVGRQTQGGDQVTLSPESRELSEIFSRQQKDQAKGPSPAVTETQLTEEELRELQQLKIRDAEVRAHEQAHLSAAGQYASSGASFTYQQGPDGARYAIGGEVNIDISKEKNPEATIEKMQAIRRAALAPANPSPADRQIAAQASATEAQARQELLSEVQTEAEAATLRPEQSSPFPEHISSQDEGPVTAPANTGGGRSTKAMISQYIAISNLT